MKKQDIPHPIFKWAGGKASLIPTFEKMNLLPNEINGYYEPFFGAGAMFFYLWNKGIVDKAVISDINIDLYNVYNLIKYHCDELIDYSSTMDLDPQPTTYYRNRDRFNELKQQKYSPRNLEQRYERAILMIYLNKAGYSGMYRENKQGFFNVPCGNYHNPTIIDVDNLFAVHDALKHVTIKHHSFEKIIPDMPKNGDFVYLDPPYMPYSDVSHFRDYHQSGFDNSKQETLCEAFTKLSAKHVNAMLSNSSNPQLNDMYRNKNKQLKIITVPALRLINQKNVGRVMVNEFVIMNY